MRLFYLRRFENLMMDMATDEPRLQRVIQMVETYNRAVIDKCLALGAGVHGIWRRPGPANVAPHEPDDVAEVHQALVYADVPILS